MARYGALPPEQRQVNLKCTVSDCSKFRGAKGLCHNHYRRKRLYGDVNYTKIRAHTGERVREMPEYRTYRHMLDRCYNKNDKDFEYYGGRGIRVCDRWLENSGKGFNNFLSDMGQRPSSKHSIDRINNDGNYEPSNCRWATRTQQMNNTSRNRLVTIRGETKTASQWAKEAGLRSITVHHRLAAGWTGEKLLAPIGGAR